MEIWLREHKAHKALSFAKRVSTSDSPLVVQLLTAALLEVSWKAVGSPSTSFSFSVALTISLSITLSLSSEELWPWGYLYLRPDSEYTATLGWDRDCWASGSLSASLAWVAFITAEPALIFCRERDLCNGALMFSVSGKQTNFSKHCCVRLRRMTWFMKATCQLD